MICCYIRSSLVSSFKSCAHKAFIQYGLGMRDQSGLAADKGNVFHKTMEQLALLKLAQQNGTDSWEDDLLGTVTVQDCEDASSLHNWVYDEYVKSTPHHDWTSSDFTDCKRFLRKALERRSGEYDPRNRTIIQPEQVFDFEVKKPWARYKYPLPDGQFLKGYLGLKGTMDLVSEIDADTYEITDYKTGGMDQYENGYRQPKDQKYFETDFQLRLYHYAATRLFPDKNLLTTIYYVDKDRTFTKAWDKAVAAETEEMIREKFELITRTNKPKWIAGAKLCDYCSFKIDKMEGSNKTICQFVHDEVAKHGADATTLKYADYSKVVKYQDGGGRRNKDEEL